ncbi:hypothetical protein SDJN03_11347, partial [Cucurbita argyrosperma subsp. sororia]
MKGIRIQYSRSSQVADCRGQGRLCISIWSPIAFLSTQKPFLIFGEGQVNFPTERLQQVLHFSNRAGFISDNQFASRPYYSIHLCQDRLQFAPVQEKKMISV